MAIGAALALRGGDRLPVAVLGDGDYLMGLTALWTGVHYRIPVLIVIANNESFFNDELHQERMARVRGRPVENRWIGLRMSDPDMDLAGLARDQGAKGYGPVRTVGRTRRRDRAGRGRRAGGRGGRDRRARRARVLAHRFLGADAPYSGAASDRASHAGPRRMSRPTRACLGIAGSITAAAGTSRTAAARSRSRRRRRGERSGTTIDATADDVDRAVAAARAAFPAWRDTPAQERAKAIRAAAAILLQHADELAWLEALDTGNPFQAMRFDVEISAAYMDYFAGLVTEIKGSTIPIGAGTLNYTLREPLGVVGRIGAFNHPLLFTAGKCGAPLAAGNTLVVKPADQTPLSSLRIAELWDGRVPARRVQRRHRRARGGRGAGRASESGEDRLHRQRRRRPRGDGAAPPRRSRR